MKARGLQTATSIFNLKLPGKVILILFAKLFEVSLEFRKCEHAITSASIGQGLQKFERKRGMLSWNAIADLLTIPVTVKPGKGYRFKITDSRNKDQIVISAPFEVKRKIPLAVKAIPVVLAGFLIFVGTSGNKGDKMIPDPPVK